MTIREKLEADYKTALVAKDALKVSVIRMLKSSVQKSELSKKKEISDDDTISIIQASIKQRKESIEQYTKGNRADLAGQEEAEMKILETYLPPQLSEDEVRKLVEQAVKDTGALTAKDTGKVMGKLMPLVKGKTDGSTVSRVVREFLK